MHMWVIEWGVMRGGSMCICGSLRGVFCVKVVCAYVGL